MKTNGALPDPAATKRGHVVPASDATHPSNRWETLFVYSFICKFTNLRGKVDGLDTPMDFEEALLSPEASPMMTAVLARFVQNLRPQTRNLNTDQISSTVAAVMAEYLKTSERTAFWNNGLMRNDDPFAHLDGGFFSAEWDLKLKILRVLVDLQLGHCENLKSTIDRAWGLTHNKHKKTAEPPTLPDPSDPESRENLSVLPIGQDKNRTRYWIADDSPRLWTSTNPWKVTADFRAVATTKDEYIAVVEDLKSSAPEGAKSQRESAHMTLITALESRIEAIDAEMARVARARKKREQRNLLLAQSQLRETRTRRQTRRPNYLIQNESPSEDDGDEYAYQEPVDDGEYDELMEDSDVGPSGGRRRASTRQAGVRRSTRTTAGVNGSADEWAGWRGERRSARLGAPPVTQSDGPPKKRSRTVDSTTSDSASIASGSVPSATAMGHQANGNGTSISLGAAAIKPTEVAMDQVAGKKKSKFWFYAVEPVLDPTLGHREQEVAPPASTEVSSSGRGDTDNERSLEGSPAPASEQMDES